MQRPSEKFHARVKAVIAIALTFTAGVVDIVWYLAVYHILVAHPLSVEEEKDQI
jgi:hypothetical protein